MALNTRLPSANTTIFGASLLMDDVASEGPEVASPLLRLAAELRNTIYELVIAQTKIIEPRTNGRFTNKPGLLGVCRQIRLEALPIFLHLAPLVARSVFEICDFDFRPVMAYIDTLNDTQRTALGRRRKLLIKIALTCEAPSSYEYAFHYKYAFKNWESLRPWLRYCSTILLPYLDAESTAREGSYEFVGTVPYAYPSGHDFVVGAENEPVKKLLSAEWRGIERLEQYPRRRKMTRRTGHSERQQGKSDRKLVVSGLLRRSREVDFVAQAASQKLSGQLAFLGIPWLEPTKNKSSIIYVFAMSTSSLDSWEKVLEVALADGLGNRDCPDITLGRDSILAAKSATRLSEGASSEAAAQWPFQL
ncbi:hypothetical protein LTR17_005254 [Elasticomyces elasticus]|nr:hypothetical protein LTR17_005254 [Elasticomyces elasticus]